MNSPQCHLKHHPPKTHTSVVESFHHDSIHGLEFHNSQSSSTFEKQMEFSEGTSSGSDHFTL
jgi:hypothetical protein